SQTSDPSHSKQCDGIEFALHKLDEKIRSTPQCIECEAYPKTVHAYAVHLHRQHNYMLTANGVYLECSCGHEVHNYQHDPDHIKKVCG
ncbi:hypothetical protein PENTCL1PPCAC_12941, partial [Pristionchus entomophagus]